MDHISTIVNWAMYQVRQVIGRTGEPIIIIMLNRHSIKSWRDGSVVKNTWYSAEDLGSIPNTHMVANNYWEFQFQRIWNPPWASQPALRCLLRAFAIATEPCAPQPWLTAVAHIVIFAPLYFILQSYQFVSIT